MSNNNHFENVGRKIDEFLSKGPLVFITRRVTVAPMTHRASYDDVVSSLIARAGQDVEVRSIDSTFEYNDIIRWVEEHAIGDTLYIAKGYVSGGTQKALCVFFGREDRILSGIQYPKICYFYNRLNPSIMDLFADGKSIFVQSFKVVEE
jgi:hypothetical protein